MHRVVVQGRARMHPLPRGPPVTYFGGPGRPSSAMSLRRSFLTSLQERIMMPKFEKVSFVVSICMLGLNRSNRAGIYYIRPWFLSRAEKIIFHTHLQELCYAGQTKCRHNITRYLFVGNCIECLILEFSIIRCIKYEIIHLIFISMYLKLLVVMSLKGMDRDRSFNKLRFSD